MKKTKRGVKIAVETRSFKGCRVLDLFEQIIEKIGPEIRPTLQIVENVLVAVAKRATQLKDPELDMLMLRLALYTATDPSSPDYNKDLIVESSEEPD